jgi:hypothetical protein
MISGGAAAIFYGEPRLTTDVDLVVVLSDTDVSRLHTAFDTSEFYVPPAEVLEVEAHRRAYGHFNIIHNETAFRADIYIAGTDSLHAWALSQRRQVYLQEQSLWIAPPEYVILRKLQYFRDGGSAKHLQDIRTMLQMSNNAINHTILQQYVDRLRLQSEWDEVVTAE